MQKINDGGMKIDCFRCAHFFVTWDAPFPRGCRAFDFKGPEMPSGAVLRESGEECALFQPKGAKTNP